MPRGGGSPGRRSEPTSIEASGTSKRALSNTSTTCQANRRNLGARPGGSEGRTGILFISGFAPPPCGHVLRQHDQSGDAVQHPDHRRPVAEAEVLESVETY